MDYSPATSLFFVGLVNPTYVTEAKAKAEEEAKAAAAEASAEEAPAEA